MTISNEDPTQGRELGEQPYDDPTQSRQLADNAQEAPDGSSR